MVAVALPSRTQPGSTDRYELHAEIGCGGCCRVYRATDSQTQQEVAIKKVREDLPLQVQPNDRRFARDHAHRILQHEASLHSQISHPAIPQFYLIENITLVMGYVPFQTVERYQCSFARRLPPLRAILAIGLQLSAVLIYLHQLEIIYGDLSLNNVLIGPGDQIVLVDFGLARRRGEECPDLHRLGTTGYAAPELFQEEPPTEKADIFSLGAVLHQLLSGRHPRCNQPLYVFKQLDSVPRAFARLVEHMVAFSPEDRPPARDIYEEMLTWAQQQGVSLPKAAQLS